MPSGRSAGDPAPLLEQLGANLRLCREEIGLTPEQLAAGAGMGVELLIELEEAGGAIPSIGLFLRLPARSGAGHPSWSPGSTGSPTRSSRGRGRSR